MIIKFISRMLRRRGRGAGGITYDEAVAVARRYGIGQAIEVACRKYGVSPRQAWQTSTSWSLEPPTRTYAGWHIRHARLTNTGNKR